MGLATNLVRKAAERAWVRVMNRAGRVLGRFFDTSADAPDSHFVPKRDVYRTMKHEAPAEHHE